MRLIISTVGKSLISNLPREQQVCASTELLINQIRNRGEVIASAETNALSRIIKEGDTLVFLYSDTPEGDIASLALTEYYKRKNYNSRRKVINGLNYSHDRFMSQGLKSLVNTLIDEIRIARRRGLEPIINATGGFKAEIAYATLVGLLFSVTVYYIHEVFQNVISMPPTPINWDYSLLAEYEDFFEWLQKEFRRKEKVQRRLHGVPDGINLLLEDDADGYITLSPAGQVYFAAYQDALQQSPSLLLSSEAVRFYERLDETQRKIIDTNLRKLRIDCLRQGGSGRVYQSDCLIYPRGNCSERIYYFENNKKIYICEIAFHESNYEELLKRGVKKDKYTEFIPWQGA
jgi:putative CRISPR-associated protein (TIGR02619 family)